VPYVLTSHDPLWSDCSFHWQQISKKLAPYAETATALLVEPIIQGVTGMKLYSKDLLCRLREWCTQHNVHLIADEIMTGLGRTGKMLAVQYADIEPDFLCLGKGLTGGWAALSAVLTNDKIYQIFYDDHAADKAFLHSHTYAGNALATSIAFEVLTIVQELNLAERAQQLGNIMYQHMLAIAEETNMLTQVRHIGAIVAADLVSDNTDDRLAYRIYQKAVTLGALLRPLGNTIYWLPPLTTEFTVIDELSRITRAALLSYRQ